MKPTQLTELAKAAQRDGLTLLWSITYLMEKLERMPGKIAAQEQRDSRTGDASAQSLRLESEALALVLAAVVKAYPAGANPPVE